MVVRHGHILELIANSVTGSVDASFCTLFQDGTDHISHFGNARPRARRPPACSPLIFPRDCWVRSQDDHPGKITAASVVPQDISHSRFRAIRPRAFELEDEDQWINDFIKRLNCVVEEIGPKNEVSQPEDRDPK